LVSATWCPYFIARLSSRRPPFLARLSYWRPFLPGNLLCLPSYWLPSFLEWFLSPSAEVCNICCVSTSFSRGFRVCKFVTNSDTKMSRVGCITQQITSRRIQYSEFIPHSLLQSHNSQSHNYCHRQYHNYISYWRSTLTTE
jgi:hypothetical protein